MKKKLPHGRQAEHFVDSSGKQIFGLARRPSDGRWRIIGTNTTFTEPDEAKAIQRFYNLKTHGISQAEIDEIGKISYVGSVAFGLLHGFMLTSAPDAEERMWRWIGEEIRKAPELRAKMSGIEQIAYFDKLQPPEALPTFDELKNLWKENSLVKPQERRLVLAAFEHFITHGKVAGMKDITDKAVVSYRSVIYKSGRKGKTQQHLFNRIRRVFTFAQSQAVAVQECANVLNNLKLLTPSEETVSLDPHPISVTDFHKLLATATGDDRAMLLMMLNCGLYLQEVVNLKWSNIREGCLIAHRGKKDKVVRVAVLWAETLKALEAVAKRDSDIIFFSATGKQLTVSGAGKRYRKIRKAAKIAVSVEANNIRDGSATAAFGNAEPSIVNLLLGHRSGMQDHYIKRNPKMVQPATDAIYRHYFQTAAN